MEETKRMTRHVPVLFSESLELLGVRPGMRAVDATLGGGGHTRALLDAVGPDGRLYAFDRDAGAVSRFEATLSEEERARVTLWHRNYSDIREALSESGEDAVDAILADLGFSSDQIEDPSRGLSFQSDGPLDMRLDRSQGETAAELIARLPESELASLIRLYGDEADGKRIAHAIKASGALTTTRALRDAIESALPRRMRSGIHPATKTFQALRIAVNHEFEHLERFLEGALASLRPGGRLAVISFHSGEDRLVKRFIREAERGCVCPKEAPVCRCGKAPLVRRLTKKPVAPGDAEVAANPRARSAKLRVIEKL